MCPLKTKNLLDSCLWVDCHQNLFRLHLKHCVRVFERNYNLKTLFNWITSSLHEIEQWNWNFRMSTTSSRCCPSTHGYYRSRRPCFRFWLQCLLKLTLALPSSNTSLSHPVYWDGTVPLDSFKIIGDLWVYKEEETVFSTSLLLLS